MAFTTTNNNGAMSTTPITALPGTNLTGNISVETHEGCIITFSSDGTGDLISPETEQLIARLKSAVVITVLFVFGGPANLVNMMVFFKQGLSDRVNLCLFSLAVVDLATLTFYFLLYVEHIFMFNSPDLQGRVHTFLMNNKILLFYSCTAGSKLLTSIIAMERCFCVLFPLQAKTLLRTKTMAVTILTVIPTVCFLRLAVMAKYEVVCFYDQRRKITFMAAYVTGYAARNKEMLNFLDGIFYGFFINLGCPLVVLISTVITIGKLWQTAAWRQQTSSANTRNERAVTKMLVVLSLMFLIYNLPQIWTRIYQLFNTEFSGSGRYRYFFFACTSFAEAGIGMESSLTFIIYYSASSRIRMATRSLFIKTCCLRGNVHQSSQSKNSTKWRPSATKTTLFSEGNE